ncbi:50S ribosomal protein L10 [Ancylomarina salipaludis]|uniref:Large ribosomal subunit protein uL10 n=1 Tax=Ancylomarina salipaludis TaxID=2501299 RepID=A0A4Q1JQ83_9BACT|nr:50S ribosomal protein L10 [Ancylomarina salipaludis]RXQ97358.1 50S ribosomal protein L10 [Ancylomarina salipaludis]
MKKEDKIQIIDSLTEQINASNHFYLADTSGMNAEATSAMRRACFEKQIKMIVVKNTLLRAALQNAEVECSDLTEVLKGATSLILTEVGNAPAKLIKEFSKGKDLPALKGAYVEGAIYVGAGELDTLVAIKSKEELIGDIIAALQSPIQKVVSALENGKGEESDAVEAKSEEE